MVINHLQSKSKSDTKARTALKRLMLIILALACCFFTALLSKKHSINLSSKDSLVRKENDNIKDSEAIEIATNKSNKEEKLQAEKIKELAIKKQIQPSHGTQMNRYPEQYTFLKELITQNQSQVEKKILSFGCSTGEETLTLAQQYFTEPLFKVFGVDVTDYAIEEATKKAQQEPEGKITILDGREVSLKDYGPFDAVLGNSVFCIYGKRDIPFTNITYVMDVFPFSLFESMLDNIDSYLKVGGVLTVFNSNYNFMDTYLAERYKPIPDKKCPDHFVPRIDRKNKKFVDIKGEMVDCLYKKEKSKM